MQGLSSLRKDTYTRCQSARMASKVAHKHSKLEIDCRSEWRSYVRVSLATITVPPFSKNVLVSRSCTRKAAQCRAFSKLFASAGDLALRTSTESFRADTEIEWDFYRLMSVIVHFGRDNSGHWVIFRRSPHKESWLRISDASVTTVSWKTVAEHRQSVCQLIYEKVLLKDL